jgi:hypothetical protein
MLGQDRNETVPAPTAAGDLNMRRGGNRRINANWAR